MVNSKNVFQWQLALFSSLTMFRPSIPEGFLKNFRVPAFATEWSLVCLTVQQNEDAFVRLSTSSDNMRR